jgi:hypothetical protein
MEFCGSSRNCGHLVGKLEQDFVFSAAMSNEREEEIGMEVALLVCRTVEGKREYRRRYSWILRVLIVFGG